MFISGDSARDLHFKAFLHGGLLRWNESRAVTSVQGQPTGCGQNSVILRDFANKLGQRVTEEQLDPDY